MVRRERVSTTIVLKSMWFIVGPLNQRDRELLLNTVESLEKASEKVRVQEFAGC